MPAGMLVRVIDVGVQTWGSDVAALRRYWRRADELGYARITYGDGLWPWTHDGWTMLGALAAVTHTARIGPTVTYAFDPAAHHPSWLAKRAVSVDHLSGGRLDLRLAVGAEDAATAAWWESHDHTAFARAHRSSVTLNGVSTLAAVATLALEGFRGTPKAARTPRPPR